MRIQIDGEEYYDTRQAAERAGVVVATIRRWCQRNEVRCRRVRRGLRYRLFVNVESLEEYLRGVQEGEE